VKRPSVIWKWDNSSSQYVDLTEHISQNTNFSFLDDANDVFYIGNEHRFVGLYADLSSSGNYSGIKYEYLSNGDTWKNLHLRDSYSFSESRYVRWVLPPTDWVRSQFTEDFPHSPTSPPESVEYYWVKITVVSLSATAVIDKLRVFPYASYTSHDKISNFLQIKRNFDYSTTPTDLAVEDLIRRAEDRIDYVTYKSFRFNASPEEILQYNRYGTYPRRRDIIKVYGAYIWDGGSWQLLQEGRTKDYFVDYNRGMIYFTRLWLLPATYGMAGRYMMYGHGEFSHSVKLDYAWGRDPENCGEMYIAEDIATKMVASDLLRHADFSHLIVSGSDKVSYSEKIRFLEEDVDRKLTELQGVTLW
jgi:hypothetical protein